MGSPNSCASIAMHDMKRTFTYNNTPMIAFSVHYPNVTLRHNPCAQQSINREIQAQVNEFYRYVANDLARQAVATYREARQNGFPFHRYDAVLNYEITYNQHCHLSLYSDQYAFTGGAHGNTVRNSDTWSLESGRRIPLSEFFPAGQDYRALLIDQITKQADERMQEDSWIFFEDYRSLIVEYFNEERYYLTPSGIAIYYQQYDIAPYVTGIVVFTIPYKAIGRHPSCCK